MFSAVLGAWQRHPLPVEPSASAPSSALSAGVPPPPASAGHPPRPIPTYEPGPTSAALCDAFRARAHARDAKLPTVRDVGGGGFAPSKFDDACFATPGGAWALDLGAIRAEDGVDEEGARIHVSANGSFRAIHLDAAGKRAEGRGPRPHTCSNIDRMTDWAAFVPPVSLAGTRP